jgi:hypothetical protein
MHDPTSEDPSEGKGERGKGEREGEGGRRARP